MPKPTKMITLLIGILLVLANTIPAFAQYTPAIAANDQAVIDGTVVVKIATANALSWVVIHADDGGKPGTVLGEAPIAAGPSLDVVVPIDVSGLTDTLHAMLHDDLGTQGTYEFPGADVPTQVDGKIVMIPFKVTGQTKSILATAKEAGNFATFLAAVDAAGLTSTLMGEGPLTVFAPSDAAFAAIPQETLDTLMADKDTLSKVLTYHVLPGLLKSADITNDSTADSIQGEPLTFQVADGAITVNGAKVDPADIEAGNGVLHVLDQVLLPPSMQATGTGASSTETAATDVVTSTEMTSTAVAETTTVTDTTDTATSDAGDSAIGGLDLMDTLVAGEFDTMVAAIQAAGLEGTLKGDGPYTVFAPTDEAFNRVPKETMDALMANPQGELLQILYYHLAQGKTMASDISDGATLPTFQGSSLTFAVQDGAVTVNGVKIIATDIPAKNGVIHVIDTVLTPSSAGSTGASTETSPSTGSTEPTAPTTLPQTGGSSNPAATFLVVALVLAGLVGSTLVTRRQNA